ncbi:MAG TPA: SDR family oxidoreductase [Casimicrobiaceae bacterium]|nr:SDR family oxidoreductase [Casimicrobiaceae bacterium]
MRILILGANGMLGHAACRVLGRSHEVFGTCRGPADAHPGLLECVAAERLVTGFEAGDETRLEQALATSRPAVVLNAIGIVKQKKDAQAAIPSIRVNSLFPHELARACDRHAARLVQVSTDCVFSGRRGLYAEDDVPDPVDLYGRSKLLGEVTAPPHLTLRTSIIGRELGASAGHPTSGLLEWLLSQRGRTVRGYARAIFSGVTTTTLAGLLLQLLDAGPLPTGLFHLASSPISKYDLLRHIDHALGLGARIERDDEFVCDRSLNGRKLVEATGLRIPGWDAMIDELRCESREYESGGPFDHGRAA